MFSGHIFKSLNTSGLIPAQGKFIADKVDSAWYASQTSLTSSPDFSVLYFPFPFFFTLHAIFLQGVGRPGTDESATGEARCGSLLPLFTSMVFGKYSFIIIGVTH